MKKFLPIVMILMMANSVLAGTELRCRESKDGQPIRAQARKFLLASFRQSALGTHRVAYKVENIFSTAENEKLLVQVVIKKQLPANHIAIASVSLVQLEKIESTLVSSKATSFEGSRILGTELDFGNRSVGIECSIIESRFSSP